ncbi:MAG: DUF1566 domain-containing protein [Betaproteobacteria bacterium]|nr:DUF1566 domain-containing protein [Betaproteobacteria bacterium]
MKTFRHLSILMAFALWAGLPAARALTCTDATIPPSNPDSAYTVNGDGTVTDTRNGLMWKQCAEGQSGSACAGGATGHTWSAALGLAAASRFAGHSDWRLRFAGHSDWRLPNAKELRSLVERCRANPAINDTVFPATPSSHFWSGSPNAYGSHYAWLVSFNYGYVSYYYRYYDYSVRLVRGGQSFGAFDGFAPPAANAPPVVSQLSALTVSGTTMSGYFSIGDADGDLVKNLKVHFSRTPNGSDCIWPAVSSGFPTTLGWKNFSMSCPGLLGSSGTIYYKVEAWDVKDAKAEVVARSYNYVKPAVINFPLSVNAADFGSGTVAGNAGGISCTTTAGKISGVCSSSLVSGMSVRLTASEAAGSTFTGWSGACSGTSPACDLTMDAAKSVTASFAAIGACDASNVASIAANGYAFAHSHQAFDVLCQNGRYGVVRLPGASNRDALEVCAFQQSQCAKSASWCVATPSASALEAVYAARNGGLALLDNADVGALARWICQ